MAKTNKATPSKGEKDTLLGKIREKYKDQNCDMMYVAEIDSHLAAGLSMEDIESCLDKSAKCGEFIGCLEGKRFPMSK